MALQDEVCKHKLYSDNARWKIKYQASEDINTIAKQEGLQTPVKFITWYANTADYMDATGKPFTITYIY